MSTGIQAVADDVQAMLLASVADERDSRAKGDLITASFESGKQCICSQTLARISQFTGVTPTKV